MAPSLPWNLALAELTILRYLGSAL
jgi:hypothetical protein